MNKQVLFPKNLKKIVTPFQEGCQLCGGHSGLKISEIAYWNLKESDIVMCAACGHSQLSPMLTPEENQTGAHAYHLLEFKNISEREQGRNAIRCFRRGVLFASELKRKNILPKNILEIGPGNGFFLEGVRFIFSESNFTVLDVVDEVLESCRKKFGFAGLKGTPESLGQATSQKFDLIIARDVIEHLIDVNKSLKEIASALAPEGFFHFITPTGCTDYWVYYTTWMQLQRRSELLINHVQYFDGRSLGAFLESLDLKPIEFYGYGLKSLRKGRGWKGSYSYRVEEAKGRSAEDLIADEAGLAKNESTPTLSKDIIFSEWPLRIKNKTIVSLYCAFKHSNLVKLPAAWNVGEEIFGLFQRSNR